MSDCASPPPDRTPLEHTESVFRLGRSTSASTAAPLQLDEAFLLSSEDKKQKPPMLSVWAESHSSPEQALNHLAGTGTFQVLRMLVGDVVLISDENGLQAGLQVVRDYHQELNRTLPAWCGHAGVVGLDEGGKMRRKFIRSALCDLVNRRRPFATATKPNDTQIEDG